MTELVAAPARARTGLEARWLTAALEWQSRAVVVRHLRVYLHNWHTAFLPPVGEPVTVERGELRVEPEAATQQLYQENLYDFSRRDRRLNATLQGQYRFGRVQALFEQRDIYQTDQNGTRTERL